MMWSALSARAKASAMTWSAVSGRAKDAAMQLLLHNTCKVPNQHTVDGQVGICMDRGRKELTFTLVCSHSEYMVTKIISAGLC